MRNPLRKTVILAGAVTILLAAVGSASALQYVTSCDPADGGNSIPCTTNCLMITDITCDASNPAHNGLSLTNGADLDMNGKNITFTGSTYTKRAITLGANSLVKNSDNVHKSTITGSFGWSNAAIWCTSQTNTKVTGIKVSVSSGSGISGVCETVEDNVVISQSTVGSDGIRGKIVNNNFVSGFQYGIGATTADHNIVMTKSGETYGVTIAGTGASLTGNAIFGPASDLVDPFASGSFAENYCDITASNCTSCVSSGFCSGETTPTVPFSFP